jgi:apolipoprotein N-acyltransferase
MNKAAAFCKNHYYLLTSVLMFFSFPSFDVWVFKGFPFFAWISLVPLLLYVRGKRFKELFPVTFLAGLAGNLLTYDWIGHFGQKIPGGYLFVMVMLSLTLTVFLSIKIAAAELLSSRYEKLRVLIYPGVWIIVDWIQSIGFLAFPMPYWGYSQYPFTSFIQLASLIGILGITFIIILFNSLLTELIAAAGPIAAWKFRKFRLRPILALGEAKRFIAFLSLICIAAVAGAVLLSLRNDEIKRDLRVTLVQTCISPWEDWDRNKFEYLTELKRYTEDSLEKGPDFIIWSESATLATISYNYARGMLNDFDLEVCAFARALDRPLLTGEIGIVDRLDGMFLKRYPQNNAVLIDRQGGVVKSYPKIHLVPFGEWFPYEKWFPAVKRLTEQFGGSSFIPGKRPVIFEIDSRKFGVLICYEGIFNRLCRDYRNLGAEFLVNITNDGWTHTYKGHMQHFAASIFRAVENGIWYVRAGNTGYTALIDPYGRIRSSMPILEKGYLTGDLDFSLNHATVYSMTGDLVLYAAMAFIILLSGVLLFTGVRTRFFK